MNKYVQFDDLQDFWDFSFRESSSRNKSSRNADSDWYGDVSWTEAKVLANSGWIEGMNEVKKMSVELSEIICSKIEKWIPEYTYAGNIIDIGMFLSNSPEYFIIKNPTEQELSGKIVKLVCSISFLWQITPQIIIQRGAMICALVDALEISGYSCEIIINQTATSYGGKFEVDVCVKKAHQSLNITEVAFCLAHPAMLRRFMFSVAELEGWADYATAYGCPATATEKGDVYIDEIFSLVVPNSEAIEWVITQLKKQGIQISDNIIN
ncbi:DUF7192 family protein [Halpernia frigidisoli]|uniref:DUF7192 domain-containing protein n=1 Tax=Halpernia frigidisoli TaxID=1125876 RepID=A0A1I3CUI7_9FLAO|nr:hypothetical protein [Halpernia frigidisoli]SFH78026.1 hypothetical protein SAMN05443292_0080 [Halpernia frigidisoli]